MKKSASSQVMDDILADIFTGSLRAGQILTERMLMEVYGCSKTTLREALVMMIQARVLKSIPRMGYEVLPVREDEAVNSMEYRRILEVGFLRLHFDRITPEIVERLKECNALCCAPNVVDRLDDHWERNAQFHRVLMEAVGGPFVQWNLEFVLNVQKRAVVQYLQCAYNPELAVRYMGNHSRIIQAIEAGDAEAACRALEDDLSVLVR